MIRMLIMQFNFILIYHNLSHLWPGRARSLDGRSRLAVLAVESRLGAN